MRTALKGAVARTALMASVGMPMLHVVKEAGNPDNEATKEAAELKKMFEGMLDGTATKKELEELEKRITDSAISRDDVMEACKQAIDAHLASAPSQTEDPEKAEWKELEGNGGFKREIRLPTMAEFNRAVMGNIIVKSQSAGNITGAPEGALDVSAALAIGNPFRQDIMVLGMTEGVVKIPILPEKAFTFTAGGTNKPAKNDDNTETGSTNLVAGEADSRIDIGNPAMQDLPGIRAVIEFEMMQRFSTSQGARVFAALKASVVAAGADSAGQVKTGAAAALPDAGDIVGKTADVVAAVPAAYRMGATWHISRTVEALLNKATSGTGGEYAFNPGLGIMMLHGYPVRVNDQMEAGNAANHVSATFGAHRQGVILGERKTLTITDNPYTRPGWRTFYGDGRFEAGMWHAQAVAGLITKA